MPNVSVGTFNLNNLFSRYNFKAEITDVAEDNPQADMEVLYTFSDQSKHWEREFRGRLIEGKSDKETARIAKRIKAMNVDILAVQEVEDILTLKEFVRDYLDGMYPHVALIEGNDPRFIDLGILSKLPIGALTSWQQVPDPADPAKPIFGRDLLEVEILNRSRKQRLFTLFNNHLKSHFVPYDVDQEEGARLANERRQRQATVTAQIIKKRMRPNSRFIVVGDMNDPADSKWLAPLIKSGDLKLKNALTAPQETRPAKADDPGPSTTAWTHRFKPSGKPAEYHLYDQIWLSPALAGKQVEAWIERRTTHGGDGSDHDPSWVVLKL